MRKVFISFCTRGNQDRDRHPKFGGRWAYACLLLFPHPGLGARRIVIYSRMKVADFPNAKSESVNKSKLESRMCQCLQKKVTFFPDQMERTHKKMGWKTWKEMGKRKPIGCHSVELFFSRRTVFIRIKYKEWFF